MQNEYTVGSLFSGIGGIEIGFEKEGFKTKWFIEKEPYAQAILKKRFPGTIIYEDVTKIDFRTIPKVDVFTGGFPCQDISGAGKRVGIEGSRSSLWKYYAEAIRVLRPKIAFIENVSALAIRGLNVVLADLAKIGYDAEWYNISASAVGAFHQRERIFIIAYPNSNWKSDESINEGQGQGFVDEISNTNIRQCNRTEKKVCSGGNSIDVSSEAIPNTSSFRCNDGCDNREERQIQNAEERSVEKDKSKGNGWGYRSSEICEVFSNPHNKRQQGRGKDEIRQELFCSKEYSWAAEPGLGRVADGIPNGVDRIKCLGNAVVPQCAEVFAKAIKMKLDSSNHGSGKVGE